MLEIAKTPEVLNSFAADTLVVLSEAYSDVQEVIV